MSGIKKIMSTTHGIAFHLYYNRHSKAIINSRYSDIPKEWEPPAPQPFKVQSDLQWYLMDADAYDQFLIGIGTGVALQVWQNTLPEPMLLQERPVSYFLKIHFSSHYLLCYSKSNLLSKLTLIQWTISLLFIKIYLGIPCHLN